MLTLTSSRLKLDRAREHAEAAEDCIKRWLRTDAYTIVSEKDPQTGHTVARAKIQSGPPAELSIILGDAIQNLRSALDHAVYALAESQLGTIPPEVEERLAFPIVGNVNRSGKASPGATIFRNLTSGPNDCLQGVPARARAFIEDVQPYTRTNTPDGFRYAPLWKVHDLNRIDKHRRVATTTAWLDIQYVSTPDGVDPKITFHRAEGPVADNDPLVTYSGAEEGVNAHFGRAVAINEPTSPDIRALDKTLDGMIFRVGWVIATLEHILQQTP